MGLLFVYVGFALGVSFLCSLLEAALLSARLAALSERRSQGSVGAGHLLSIKRHRVDDAISAILILNTLANTLGAFLAGAQAGRVWGSSAVGVFSGVLTFMILVFSEIIPKTLGAVYVRGLSPLVGWTLYFLTKLLTPALVVSRSLTRLLTRGSHSQFSRGELEAVIATASADGALSPDESKLFANLLRFNDVQIEDVMTPRTVAFMMSANATIDDLLSKPEGDSFSRIPLFRGERDNVVGYVLQHDVLKATSAGCDRSDKLERFAREIWFIPELVTVGAALEQFLERREPIAMVTDEHGGLAGLVTLEDVTETVLGTEIVDESDRIVDLRQAALELRDRRLERMRKKREDAL